MPSYLCNYSDSGSFKQFCVTDDLSMHVQCLGEVADSRLEYWKNKYV